MALLKQAKRNNGNSVFDGPSIKRYIAEIADSNPDFPEQLRLAALQAVLLDDIEMVLSGLHSLAVVGRHEDIATIEFLAEHPEPRVVKDLRTCIFELRKR